ncbi:MAG TPA: hypothetical protein VEJ89_11220 [Myxococcaceae bacterium]|nr:hypothetical protein [Myxococcaceae bacterium]
MKPVAIDGVRLSRQLDGWLPAAPFRDTIAVRSRASSARLMHALDTVTLREMPLARLLGTLRYLPGRLARRPSRQKSVDPRVPFLPALVRDMGSVVLERTAGEVILGTVGKLHQIRDQSFVPLKEAGDFTSFDAPDHEKLAMSVQAIPVDEGTVLVLEHRTQPTDVEAQKRFRRYWRFIRPAGAFVTRQLLRAVARRAERTMPLGSPAAESGEQATVR